MIVFGIVVAWLVIVVLLCRTMHQVTHAPWWEATLLDIDSLDIRDDDHAMSGRAHGAGGQRIAPSTSTSQ